MPKEPSFDEIINPGGHTWEDEWDDYYFSGMTANRGIQYPPKHAKREKPTMFAKSVQFLARALVLTFIIVGILWIADVAGELLIKLLPF